VLFYAEMAANEGHFTIAEVLDNLNNKLVRRHPHVFGDEASRAAGNRADVDAVEGSSAEVLRNWERSKGRSIACSGRGFGAGEVEAGWGAAGDAGAGRGGEAGGEGAEGWVRLAELAGLLPKLAEETAELEAEAASDDPARKPAVEAELGDLLFTVVNLGRHLGVDAEMALRGCNRRFRERFREMEMAAARPLEELAPAELEALWAGAKRKLGCECDCVQGLKPLHSGAKVVDTIHSVGGAKARTLQHEAGDDSQIRACGV
jgi:NTP pyrophosphatase (non-canonical NTP hydrolase)